MSGLSSIMEGQGEGKGEEDFHANLNSHLKSHCGVSGSVPSSLSLSHTSELMLRLAKRGSEFISYL